MTRDELALTIAAALTLLRQGDPAAAAAILADTGARLEAEDASQAATWVPPTAAQPYLDDCPF